jgi:hypothetical protein
MAKSVVAFSLEEFDPSYTRVLVGDVSFYDSVITDLGTLEVITGYADFRESKVTDLGNLTTIGRYVSFSKSQIKDLGNLQKIGGTADFEFSQITNLGKLTTIGGNVSFSNSEVTDLGNLTTIGGNVSFKRSKIESLGNLTTIVGSADFSNSVVKDIGKLNSSKKYKEGGRTISQTPAPKKDQIKGVKIDNKVGKEFWFEYHCLESDESCDSEIWYRSHQKVKVLYVSEWSFDELQDRTEDGQPRVYSVKFNDGFIADVLEDELMESTNEFYRPDPPKRMKKGGRTISQTPAPKKDQIKGSDKNKEGSSKDTESAKQINFNEKTLNSIQNKVTEHNKQYPNKKITLASAKAVVRRGMGAYSNTYRPTISGGKPNSRVAWGLARLNAFTYKIINGKSKSGKYSQDNDLIEELGYKVQKFSDGGEIVIKTKKKLIEILSKNKRYSKANDYQKEGDSLLKELSYSNSYFSRAIQKLEEDFIFIAVDYDNQTWGYQESADYLYFPKPNSNTQIKIEYKYDLKEYPMPVMFDNTIIENKQYTFLNDYEEINSSEYDENHLYRGLSFDEMLFIIENNSIKSNASMNIGKQQEETTSFAQHISQASDYAYGFNAWYDTISFQKPRYVIKVKKDGIDYKPTIKTDPKNEVDVYGDIDSDKITDVYELRLGLCYGAGSVTIKLDNNKNPIEGSRSPIFYKVYVRKLSFAELKKELSMQSIYEDGGSVLLAPNGKPSNLTPEQYKLVRTKAFKDWFGDWENDSANASKVVDENGEPLVVYHGTNSDDYYEFENKLFGYRGFYFTDKKSVARSYGSNVRQFFLNSKDFVLEDMKGGSYADNEWIDDLVENSEMDNKDVHLLNFIDPLDPSSMNRFPKSNIYIIFNKSNIKLADGSNTTFDANNPDIRYAKGGLMKRRSGK